ncbi:MAG: site-specific DNA-methyltransferase [Anaerolineae bacterium]|nr:site-specific DNA-methyltransferase [Anaerolineae bacterium]
MLQSHFDSQGLHLFNQDVCDIYTQWDAPTVIISDGPYGIGGYKGDPLSHQALPQFYEPHIAIWSQMAMPFTTLWFWNTEIGWATVHPLLEKYGWEYRTCNVWNKGMAHIAGNTNTQVIRKLPVVTEVCVHYVRKVEIPVYHQIMTLQQWLRYEWERTGIPIGKTNAVCGVKNAATRKYFTKDHLWYFPPVEAFEKLVAYANTYGITDERPFFSLDGIKPLSGQEWEQMRAKFYCPIGITNVWNEPPLAGKERLKNGSKAVHLNQKPLKIIRNLIQMSSDENDIIWEPFGGLFTGAVASHELKRRYFGAEIDEQIYQLGLERLQTHLSQLPLFE